MPGRYLNAGALHATAKRACLKAMQEDASEVDICDNALTSILLSCATLEAYINEAFMLIDDLTQLQPDSERINTFVSILKEVESSRGSTRLKYLMGLTVLTDKPFDKGDQPYQDFDLLFSIRNELMHYKLEKITDEPHRIIQKLRSKNICDVEKGVKKPLHVEVATAACAKWACNTAADMINTIQSAISAAAKEKEVSPIKLFAGIIYTRVE